MGRYLGALRMPGYEYHRNLDAAFDEVDYTISSQHKQNGLYVQNIAVYNYTQWALYRHCRIANFNLSL